MIVLSHFQVIPALRARQEGRDSVEISPDLGLTTVEARIYAQTLEIPTVPQTIPAPSAGMPPVQQITWDVLDRIASSENSCFVVENDSARKIQVFAEETNRLYTLYPTPRAPTMLISGIPMHRIKGTDPWQDTMAKVKTVAPVAGRVLDTATGLGYTGIVAAETAQEVITVELDPAATEIARLNPWSRGLFENDKIRRLIGDSFEVVPTFENGYFSRIIHDPPMFNLAGELYSGEFYQQLYRVLARGGKMFHYIGDLESRSGRNVVKGVIRRLQQVGFKRVRPQSEAYGVAAFK